MCVPVNYVVTLSVSAESTGILSYQWFTDDEKVVYEVGGALPEILNDSCYCFAIMVK